MDIKEVLIPRPKVLTIMLVFLQATLVSLSLICIDSLIIWFVWNFVVVPKFGLISLGVFQVLAIVIGLNALLRAIKGA